VDAECREILKTMNESSPGNVKAEVGFLWINGLTDLIKLYVCPFLEEILHFSQLYLGIFNSICLVFNFIRLLEVFEFKIRLNASL